MFDTLIERYRPAMSSAADRACGYAERIIARLDLIHGQLAAEDHLGHWFDDRRQFTLAIASANTDVPIRSNGSSVPAYESWELEAFTNVGNVGIVRLFVNGLMTAIAANGAPAPIVARPGSQITVQSDTPAATCFLQWRVHTRNVKPVETVDVGVEELGIGGVPSPQAEIENEDRHGQPNTVLVGNVHGPNAMNGMGGF